MSNGQHYDWAKLIRQVGGKIDSRRLSVGRRSHHEPAPVDLSRDPFECPSCGDHFPVAAPCPRCLAVPFDVRSGVRLEEHVRRPAHGLGLIRRTRTALAVASWAKSAARARRVGPPKKKPTRARVRVKGVVSVLRPVLHPDTQEPCGAWVRRREVVEPCQCRPDCTRRTILVREETAVGLLAIRLGDEMVLAGVPRSVQRVGWAQAGKTGDAIVRDGQDVEVVGVLERRVVEVPRTTSYREAPAETSVCLVGTVSSACWVLV